MALTIHLGAHKTASTHLQQSLRMALDDLRRGGVAYADPVVLRGLGLPLLDVLACGGEAGRDARRVARLLAGLRETMPELLLSDENILGGTHRNRMFGRNGMVYPFAAARLARTLELAGGGPATVCLSVRDPARFNVSAFALQVAHGNEREIGDWLMGRDPARLNWSGLARRLTAVPGVARLLVWRYEDYAALRPRLLERLLPPALAGWVPEPPPVNRSLTQPGYDWFRRMLAESGADPAVIARRARQRFRPELGHAALDPLSGADHARSAAHYAADLARLRRLPLVEFIEP